MNEGISVTERHDSMSLLPASTHRQLNHLWTDYLGARRPGRPVGGWWLALLLTAACATHGGQRAGSEPPPQQEASCEAEHGPPRVLVDTGSGTLLALPPAPRRAPVAISRSEFER